MNIVWGNPPGRAPGQQDWIPYMVPIDARTETYATITAPGYLNSVISSGNLIDPSAIVFIAYDTNTQFFQQSVGSNGVITLNVYNPGDTGFVFENVCFVASNGSNSNAGDKMNFPKQTIQAAINALKTGPTDHSLVWVLDSATYEENLVFDVAKSFNIFMPNALLSPLTGDAVTLQDLGSNYVVKITSSQIAVTSPQKAANVLGSQSNLFLYADILLGDLYTEGGFILDDIANLASSIHVASTGQMSANVINAILTSVTIDSGGVLVGKIGSTTISEFYGDSKLNGHVYTHLNIPTIDTAGRAVVSSDINSIVQYNNVSDDAYTLPQVNTLTFSDSTVAVPGIQIEFVQLGVGLIGFNAGAGVTIISDLGSSTVTTINPGSKAIATALSNTVWQISGSIQVVGP